MITLQSVLDIVMTLLVMRAVYPWIESLYHKYCYHQPIPPSNVPSSHRSSWYTRSQLTPHPNPSTLTLTDATLILLVHTTGMAGFTFRLALFSVRSQDLDTEESTGLNLVAVDARGRVLQVSASDAQGLLSLIEQVRALPQSPRGWSIREEESCPSNVLLYLPPSPLGPELDGSKQVTGEAVDINVSGLSGNGRRELVSPTQGFMKLPDPLWELLGLIEEAGYVGDGPNDEEILKKIGSLDHTFGELQLAL